MINSNQINKTIAVVGGGLSGIICSLTLASRGYLVDLYEYYKNLLTNKQRGYFEDYYFDNLSLSEIGENNNISRNAVSSQLLKIKEKLYEYEKALSLYNNRNEIIKLIDEETLKLIVEFI